MVKGRVVVIGGGITGTLTARRLLLDGWAVTLLEGQHIGAGSSSRTAAGIRQQFSTRSTVLGMRYAVQAYRELGEELGESPIVQRGYLFLYDRPTSWSEAKERVGMQQGAGLSEAEALEGPELLTRFPWLSADAALGGTFCPTDGFLHPSLVYQEAARRVRELGGELVQHAPVMGAERVGDRIVALRTPRGTWSADLVIDCTNAWTPRLARALGARALPVSPLKRYLWFLRREEAAMPAEVFAGLPMVVLPSGIYVRPENADTLLMGWAHDAPPQPDFTYEDQDTVEPGFAHDGGVEDRPWQAWMQLAEVIPAAAAFAGFSATTCGFYATTPDHNPFMGYDPLVSNLIRLVGFSGHGAMFGPFTAAVASALAAEGRDLPEVDLPVGRVSLAEFRIGRDFGAHEAQVI